MNTKLKFLYILCIFIILALSCEKAPNDEINDNFNFTANILEMTCGGAVIQFINTDSVIGEDWTNYFSEPAITFTNCALAGNLPYDDFNEGERIYFNYEKVRFFESGIFCDIGGLPGTKIQFLDIDTK